MVHETAFVSRKGAPAGAGSSVGSLRSVGMPRARSTSAPPSAVGCLTPDNRRPETSAANGNELLQLSNRQKSELQALLIARKQRSTGGSNRQNFGVARIPFSQHAQRFRGDPQRLIARMAGRTKADPSPPSAVSAAGFPSFVRAGGKTTRKLRSERIPPSKREDGAPEKASRR